MADISVHEGPRGLRIAIEGCGHGELDKIYETMQYLEQRDGKKIDLLICCGDFEAVRNVDDLECMACPPKYRSMATFYKYYSGEKIAPYLTLFIGGNHEAANHLWELYHGGWVAPRIYFLGYAGVVNFGGVRIGGLSGIYKQQHYTMGHYERPPYTESTMRSAYHIRSTDVNRLLRLQRPLDVFLSHDWPAGIARHGDTAALFRRKRFLQREVEDGSLGSPPAAQILEKLKPGYWFSAHLHTKFAAVVPHPDGSHTKFLSLDKCLPGRQFLQVVDFPEANGPLELSYDEEWLAVLRSTHSMLCLHRHVPRPPPPPEPVAEGQLQDVRERFAAHGGPRIPENFQPTAPAYDPALGARQRGHMPRIAVRNPQTVAFLELLGLDYNLDAGGAGGDILGAFNGGALDIANPEEIELGEEDVGVVSGGEEEQGNPEEIDLGDEDEEDDGDVSGGGVDPAISAVLAGVGKS